MNYVPCPKSDNHKGNSDSRNAKLLITSELQNLRVSELQNLRTSKPQNKKILLSGKHKI